MIPIDGVIVILDKQKQQLEEALHNLQIIENYYLDLKRFYDEVSRMSDCNTCKNIRCEYRPKLGENVRYNCPLYVGSVSGVTEELAHEEKNTRVQRRCVTCKHAIKGIWEEPCEECLSYYGNARPKWEPEEKEGVQDDK